MKKREEQLTFADLDLPKKRGRPRKPDGEKLTPAERAKRYREKKRSHGVRLVPISADEARLSKKAFEYLLDQRAVTFSGLEVLAARIAGKFE